MRTPIEGSALGRPDLMSEAFEAADQELAGNPWPLAVIRFKSGEPEALAELIREQGLPEESGARGLVADFVAGRFRRTKRDAGAGRNAAILAVVSLLQYVMEGRRSGRMEQVSRAASNREGKLETMDDVYRITASRFNLTAEGVQKIVERNRRRLRQRQADNRRGE